MKKLLTLAAVVCMATFAQAIAINWTTTTAVPVTSGFTATLVYTNGGTTNLTAKAVWDALQASSTAYTEIADTSAGNMGFAIHTSLTSGDISMDATPYEGTSTYYVFLTKGENVWGASFDAADTAWGQVAGTNPTAGTVNLTFSQVAVPEPTVLALLALGVAGVALRRRRMA